MRDRRFLLEELVGIDRITALPRCDAAEPELVQGILKETDKFATGVLAPLNQLGDVQGCRLEGD